MSNEARKHHKKMVEARKCHRMWTKVTKRHKKMLRKAHKAELPLSLIETHILVKLPAKSIGRCMCVCKQWRSFLSTPMFARIHLNHVTIKDEQSVEKMVEAHKKMSREAYKAELPLSLIETHILVRLPAKSIGRCMCVCKQWRSFLSTPTFVRIHLNNVTINDYKLLLFDGQRPVPFRTIPSQPKYPYPGNVFILASLDGLVCLASRESSHLMFWNPLTRAYKKLSPSRDFLFYPNDFIGFYTDSSNDYKLLYLVDGGRFGAYVYSNIMDSWRRIEFSVGSDILPWSCSPATFFGQCLYFIVTAESQRSWIICFDLNTETFRKIKSPPVPDDASDYCGSLVVLNGCIHLCVSYTIIYMDYVDVDLKHGDMWRMDGDRWVKVDAFRDKLYKEFRRQRICTASTGNWLAVLDQETNTFKQTNAEEFTTHYRYFCPPSWEYRSSRMIYVETLVSPNP